VEEKFKQLVNAGIFDGQRDPGALDGTMTRQQLATILARVAGLDTSTPPTSVTFEDVSTQWAIGYIEAAKKSGLIEGAGNSGVFGGSGGGSGETRDPAALRALLQKTMLNQLPLTDGQGGTPTDEQLARFARTLCGDCQGQSLSDSSQAMRDQLLQLAYDVTGILSRLQAQRREQDARPLSVDVANTSRPGITTVDRGSMQQALDALRNQLGR
jgi:hypothetical protein